ncbi:hypothetical protein HS960_14665 [Sphingobacterium paramultivorum]|uniref:Uncharacterized protein n=1 Tax=Sphingobacterium paramultivorum TaxID=2886510 RepID=A0A7G5E497_9SPHI|nr:MULTISPECIES: hypothetical protein [Sphingobacterium]MCS4165331.1 hypothetical protein [Sphingobacterium sp. BIGb0116]QMV68822.1 hypothetical protein HS960_14665 [Sphingobacterium paramultivorum]WSO12589.1 hypothetical protein VUL84_14655 [Sphingobacterium paramultivorum]
MKKSNILKKWHPAEMINGDLYLISLSDDQENGLQISFEIENIELNLVFDFGFHALYYQNQNENSSLKIIDDYGITGNWSLFTVEKSDLIDWIVKNSYHIVSKENVQHFIFLHADGLINVLSAHEPKVYQQKQTY